MVDSILRVTVIPGRLPASPDRSGDRGRPDPPGCRGGTGRTADDHCQVDQATDRDVFHAREGHPPGPNGPLPTQTERTPLRTVDDPRLGTRSGDGASLPVRDPGSAWFRWW